MKHYNKAKWNDAPDFIDKDCISKDNHQLEMVEGIAPQLYIVAKDVIRLHLFRMGQTKDGWTEPQPKGEHLPTRATAKPYSKGKFKAIDGGDLPMMKPKAFANSRLIHCHLIDELEEFARSPSPTQDWPVKSPAEERPASLELAPMREEVNSPKGDE